MTYKELNQFVSENSALMFLLALILSPLPSYGIGLLRKIWANRSYKQAVREINRLQRRLERIRGFTKASSKLTNFLLSEILNAIWGIGLGLGFAFWAGDSLASKVTAITLFTYAVVIAQNAVRDYNYTLNFKAFESETIKHIKTLENKYQLHPNQQTTS